MSKPPQILNVLSQADPLAGNQSSALVEGLVQQLAHANARLQESVDELKEREEALRRSEEQYRNIFDNAVEGIFQTTPQGRFLTANAALARILGFASPEELIADVTDIGEQLHVSPERRAEFRQRLQEEGLVQGFESQIRKKDGSIIWISLSARSVRGPGETSLFFEGTVEDITQRKNAEEGLRNSEALYHSLVDNLPVCIFRKDLDGRFTFGNQAFCASVKKSLQQIVGEMDVDFYPPELAHKYIADDRHILATGEVMEAIEENQEPDGNKRFVQVLKAPLFDANQRIIGIQGIFWDITARTRAEGELARTAVEFRVARSIQQQLFPSSAPHVAGLEIGVATYGYELGGASYPAEVIGGDYYDFIGLADGTLGMAIGDVSGHGIGPAMLMAEARALLRAFAQTESDVSTILDLVNRVLVPDTGDRFITMLLIKLDQRTRTLVYASAGHPSGYVLDDHGAVKYILPSTGIPLGILDDAHFPSSEPFPLNAGDIVLLLTDGVAEARAPDGEPFGSQRPLDIVRIYRRMTARQIVDNLYHAVRAFCQNHAQVDDITASAIKIA